MEASSTRKMHSLCPAIRMCAHTHEPMTNFLPVLSTGSPSAASFRQSRPQDPEKSPSIAPGPPFMTESLPLL